MLKRGGYRNDFKQRFGSYAPETLARFREVSRIWVHAVSVGEIQIALRFIEAYRRQNPHARFVLSTNTSTAHALGRKKMDARDVLIYFPLDFPPVIKRVYEAINPQKLILVECEFWPNLIREAARRQIQVALINGRMSDSSFKGYMTFQALMRRLLCSIDPICVQSALDAERMVALGAPPHAVHPVGTAKYDLFPAPPHAGASARALLAQAGVAPDAIVWVGGSTWPGEEKVLCSVYRTLRKRFSKLFLVLVPRHAERRAEVLAAVRGQGLSGSLRSAGASPADVLVVDTTGELMEFYAAADVVFVGKSLCAHGGQNPIEPALFGKPILVGPNMENFAAVMKDFSAANAVQRVESAAALEIALRPLLSDAAARAALGQAAAQLVESHRGVMDAMVRAVARPGSEES